MKSDRKHQSASNKHGHSGRACHTGVWGRGMEFTLEVREPITTYRNAPQNHSDADLGGVAEQELDLGGPEVLLADPDPNRAGGLVLADLVDALALELDINVDVLERRHHKLAHRPRHVGRDHEVVGLLLLQHHPHHPDVVLGVAPVPLAVHVAERQLGVDGPGARESERERERKWFEKNV